MIDIILPVPGIDGCVITNRIRKRVNNEIFVSTEAEAVNRAAFDLALKSLRTMPYIDQVSTDDADPEDQSKQSDYDKSLEKLVTALSMKYRFVEGLTCQYMPFASVL